MTGEFYITKEFLKQYKPCPDSYKWFCEHYPNGGKYQEILDKLCNSDRLYNAVWLLNHLGKTDDVLEIDTIDNPEKNICFAGSVRVKNNIRLLSIRTGGNIRVEGDIQTGEYIESGEYIKAQGSIKADRSIKAIGSIQAGKSINSAIYIEAGEFIKADRCIESAWYIKAGEYINAGIHVKSSGYITSNQYIKAGGSIQAGWHVEADWSIEAGRSINGGGSIKAGRHIEAGMHISSGKDDGIYAGLNVPLSKQREYGYIAADSKPKNVICGYFKGRYFNT